MAARRAQSINQLPAASSGTPRGRVAVVLVLFALLATAIFVRAFYLQVVKTEWLARRGEHQYRRVIELAAIRGAIVDRRGQPLALSAPVQDIWADPTALDSQSLFVEPLASLLGTKASALRSLLESKASTDFVYLARSLPPDQAARVMALKAPGVFERRAMSRFYPAGETAANIVGFCDIDGKGLEGIELAFDSRLRGTPGLATVVRDNQRNVVDDVAGRRESEPGADIAVSIDLRLQYLAYRELEAAVREHHAASGMLISADPRSGDILAMVSLPGFNPNAPSQREPNRIRNRPVTDTFEPGSAIKPLLIADALDSGHIAEGAQIDTGDGTFRIGTYVIHDVHPNGTVDLETLLAKSSNIGAAKIGLTLGPQAVWEGYRLFGLGELVQSGLPGEGNSTLRPWRQWVDVETASASFGYGVSVSGLQLLRAYCALANDGLMPALSILRDRTLVPPQRVVSVETASKMRALLRSVVSADGTAARAAVNGYTVAGKTGTVRMVEDGQYADQAYRAIFVGMLPAEHPSLVTLVVIDRPQGPDYFGGTVAGPVFSRFMNSAARLLQISPSHKRLPDS